MTLYLDSSCIIKLLAAEERSEEAEGWHGAATLVATSRLAFVEVHSALSRRQRDGSLSRAERSNSLAYFDELWASWSRLGPDEAAAAQMAGKHGLRALDSIHLAAAVSLLGCSALREVGFACFDRRLNEAARLEGLLVLA